MLSRPGILHKARSHVREAYLAFAQNPGLLIFEPKHNPQKPQTHSPPQKKTRGMAFPPLSKRSSSSAKWSSPRALKEKAVGKRGGLAELPWEEPLLQPIPPGDSPVEFKALEMYAAARLECTSMLASFEDLSIPDVAQFMEKRSQRLTQLDPSFVIDIAVAKRLCSTAGTGLIESKILRMLPASRKRVSLDELARGLAELDKSSLVKLLPRSASSSIEAVTEVAHHIHNSLSPIMIP